MKLLIDIGNTLTCLKVNSNSPYVLNIPTKFIKNKKKDIINFVVNSDVKTVAISSVVPDAYALIKSFIRKANKEIEIFTVEYNSKVSFKINIEYPQEIGADLMCDLEGANKKYDLPALIIDAGTATKILYLSKDNVFAYCAIIPGLELSYRALASNAALLKHVDIEQAKPLFECHNTNDVINSSIIYSHISSINGLVKRFIDESKTTPTIIMTGGYAKHLIQHLDYDVIEDNDLTFYGLEEIYRNAKYGKNDLR